MELSVLQKLAEAKRYTKLFQFEPYGWQKEFFSKGKDHPERMLCAANRVGKTYSAAREVAYHATGLYPDDWDGREFTSETLIWVGGVTNEALRDIVQKELLGGLGEELGTGAIPKSLIVSVSKRQCGIGDVADVVKVRHESGGISTLVFKSYEQGWKKWQGTAPHVVWMDEEPDDYKIYTECQTRILTSKGIILVTFTPLSGLTDLVEHFRQGKPGTFSKNVTWDDVEHLSKEDKDRLLESLPEHERDARSKGIPMMGQGRVYPVDESSIKCDPFQIPNYYFEIIGIDFGIDHDNGTIKLAYDPNTDTIYITHAVKDKNMDSIKHSHLIKSLGGDVFGDALPVAWPHDGVNREKSSGIQLKDKYKENGVSLLGRSARYDNDTGGAQNTEPVIMEIYERMTTGRFKVFSNLSHWFEEFRNYHRKDGKIHKVRDDLMAATNYAVMMRRFARQKYIKRQQMPTGAIFKT